jgi:hypothetical protein
LDTQPLHNEVIRNYVNMPKESSGVLITGLSDLNNSSKHVKKVDVLMLVDGKKINNDGTMILSDILTAYDPGVNTTLGFGEIIPYHNYIHLKKPGDSVELTLWRNNKEIVVKFPVEPYYPAIPKFEYQSTLSYYIVMGLVFLPVSFPLIKEKKQNKEYIYHLVEMAKFYKPAHKDEQVIILSDIFTNAFTEEFPLGNFVLRSVNGINIRNISQLIETVEKLMKKDDYIRFEFMDRSNIILLRSSDIKKFDRKILEETLGNIPQFVT